MAMTQYVFGVEANTKAAQQSLNALSKSLRSLQTKKLTIDIDDSRINEAASAAQLLQHELTNAMNVKTGSLDLSKLTAGLKAANTDVSQLGKVLLNAGTEGQQAFSQLANTIASSQAPVKQLSSAFKTMGTTIMNTIKWQAASSLIHGLMSTISGAISYAKNLNSTLNDIRIVTGASDAEMSKFATTANRMAKELSTTTNEFAKASLIYYQQGDSAELAAKKAAITTKAANVAFTASAREMSEMLTAVWNSYQMGEDQLEHAVDVMAALGATTASSMEEMATAMQKVAATANNVGVSMEQMSAIVSTAASVTRQAPQTIGTAWNTILNRISGLKLGETLEDGVDLNKYSKALQTIGVNILDANGELRDMGSVIDEIGAKWDSLSKAQQSALAQTIGGVRQYTQINAFFDNFDKYQKNMETAANSAGALQKQADIYAESWEAASKRVQASLETLYGQIFDDKAITKLTSFFATVINGITTLTQSFGGVGNVVTLIGTQIIESHIDQFSTKLVEIGHNIKQLFSGNAEIQEYANNIQQIQDQMVKALDYGDLSASSEIELKYDIEILNVKKQIAEQQGKLTQKQVETMEATLKNLQQDKEYYKQLAQQQEELSKAQRYGAVEKAKETAKSDMYKSQWGKDGADVSVSRAQRAEQMQLYNNIGEFYQNLGKDGDAALQQIDTLISKMGILKDEDENITLDAFAASIEKAEDGLTTINNKMKYLQDTIKVQQDGSWLIPETANMQEVFSNMLSGAADNPWFAGAKEQIAELQAEVDKLDTNSTNEQFQELGTKIQQVFKEAQQSAMQWFDELEKAAANNPGLLNFINNLRTTFQTFGASTEPVVDQATANLKRLKDEIEKTMEKASTKVSSFVTTAMALSRVATAFNSVGNAINTWKDPNVGIWQKLLTTMSTLTTVAMAANSVMKMLEGSTMASAIAAAKDAAAKAAGIPAGTALSATNLGVAGTFKVAAAAAKSFMAAVWPLLLIGAIIAVIGLLADALSKVESEEEKFQKRHSELNTQLEAQAKKTKTLTTDVASLNSIMTDTNLTYSEQIEKINEIAAAYGVQADAIDVVTGSYSRLSKKITEAALGKAALNLEQDTEAFNAAEELVTSGMWKTTTGYSQGPGGGGKSITSTNLDQNYFGVAGNNYASGYETHYAASFYRDDAWSDYNGGKRDNRTNGFYNKRDANWRAQHYSAEGEFWHRKDVQEKLASYGLYLDDSDNLRLTENASPELLAQFQTEFLDNDQWAGQYKSEGSYTSQIRSSLRSKGLDSYQTALANKRASAVSVGMLKHVDLTRGEDNQMSTADMVQLYDQIYTEAKDQGAVDNAWEIYREIGSQLNFGGYTTGNNRIQSAMDVADTIGTSKGFGVKEKQNLLSDILNYQDQVLEWENLDTGEHYEVTLTADLLMQINPTDIITDDQGHIVDINSLAANMVATRQAELDAAATNDLLVSKKDVLTKKKISSDDYQELLDSGLFGHEENGEWIAGELGGKEDLRTWTLKSQGTREALWQQHYDSTLDADITRLQDLSLAASAYADQKEEELTNAIEGYTSKVTGKHGQAAYEEDVQTRATKKAALTTGENQQDLLRRMQDESTREAALTEWVNQGYGSKDDFYTDDKFDPKKVTAKYSTVSESVRGLRSEVEGLDESLIDIDERQIAMADARTAQEDAASRLTAKRNEQEVNNLEKITKKNTALNNTLGKKGKLSADQLTELKIYDEELYNLYNDASVSAEEYDEAVRQHLIKSLQDEAAAFREAGDEESALAAEQQIAIIRAEQHSAAIDKATAAYARYSAQLKETSTEVSNYKTAAETLTKNIATGNLTEAQKVQIKQSGIDIDWDAWENATTQSQRAVIAANAWSQYLIKAEASMQANVKYANELTGALEGTDSVMQYLLSSTEEVGDDVDGFLLDAFRNCSEEAQGLAKDAYSTLVKEGKITATMSKGEVLKVLLAYLREQNSEFQDSFEQIKATGKDEMKSLWKSVVQEQKSAAQDTVDEWLAAFEKISAAKTKAFKGEKISIDNYDDYMTLMMASGETDPSEFNKKYYTQGGVMDLKMPTLQEYQAMELQNNSGLSEENFNFETGQFKFGTRKQWEDSLFAKYRADAQYATLDDDQIMELVRASIEEDVTKIFKKGNPKAKDSEIAGMVSGYMAGEGTERSDALDTAVANTQASTRGYAQFQYRGEQLEQATALKETALATKKTAYDLLETAISDTTVRDNWWETKDFKPGDLQTLADALGMTVDDLKALGWDEIQAKFKALGSEIDQTEVKFSKFDQALANGEFDNKNLSQYTTLSGERLWEDAENTIENKTTEGFEKLDDAQDKLAELEAADTEFAGQVVRGIDGKYYVITGGTAESEITANYEGTEPTTHYGEEAAETVSTASSGRQEAWRTKINDDASALDTVQLAIKADGKAAADDWEALSRQLDLTNPKIKEAYDNFRAAADECEEAGLTGEAAMDHMRSSTEALTTALLEQGGVILEDNEVNNDFLQTLWEEYQIGDALGNAFTVQSLNAMRAKTELTALQSTTSSLDSSTKKLTKNTKLESTTFKSLRKELKNSDKTLEDYLKDNKDLTEEEKDLMRDTNNLMNTFEDLGKKLGLTGEDLEDFVDQMMECKTTGDAVTLALKSDASGVVEAFNEAFDANGENNAVANAFKNWEESLGEGANEFISSAAEMFNMTEADVTTLMNRCTQAIADAGGDLTAVNWGTLANDMGVDVSTILAIMQEYLTVLQQANAIDGFDVAGLISQLQSAISAAQAFQGKHGGGGASNGTPSDSGSDSGGGGGSSKNYESHKNFTDETERYHEINQQLEKQQRLLTKLDKQKSMTFGAAHLKAMDEEIAALEKENELNAEKLNETRANLSSEATQLQRWGATMNSDGTLNYAELKAQAIAEYNDAVDTYNTSDQTAQDDLALERAKEHYEELMNLIDDYEEDLKQQDELEADMLENQIKRSGLEIEKIEYTIEINFDLNDRQIKELQYFRTKWEDTLKKQGTSFEGMIAEAYKYEENLGTLGKAMETLDQKYKDGKITQADYAAELQNLNDKMLEQLENLTTIKKTIKEAYGNTLQLASEEMQKFTSVLDHSREVMESYISMQQLMGRGQNFGELKKMYQVQYDSSLAAAKAAKTYNDELVKSKDNIWKQIEAAGGWSTAGEVLQQQWTDVTNAIAENENELLSKTQQAMEDAQAMFENTMQAAIDSFDKIMLGAGKTLSNLEDDYAYYQEEGSRYLSTAKELYEVSKLNREIEESISKSTTKASKERLKALQDVINAQSESNQLTEYDVNMMELQYKYALALEDLEDKKNAKSIVRLTRDEAGNYGYQYTANEDEVNKSAQQVEDVLDQIHDLASSRVAEIEQAALTAEREYRDGLLEIAQDTTLTLDERMLKMQELTRRHQETMNYYQEQYGNATSSLLTNQQEVYERYGVSMMENSGKLQEEINADVNAMIANTKDYAAELSRQMAPGGEIYDAMLKYKKDLNLVQDTTGLSWVAMTENTDEYTAANEKAQKAIADVKSSLDTALTSIDAATKNWKIHETVLDGVIAKYEKLNSDAVGKISDLAVAEVSTDTESTGKSGKYQFAWAYKGLAGIGSGFDSEKAARDAAVTDMTGKFKNLVTEQDSDADTATIENKVKAWIDEAVNKNKITVTEYATGGLADYTGPAWVDGTRSKPEMVLNSGDTQNILNTVDLLHSLDSQMIRNLVDTLQMSAVAMLQSFGNLSSGSLMMQKDKLEQDVHIEANFPNVTEKDEIVDAFNDLINLASQYANR